MDLVPSNAEHCFAYGFTALSDVSWLRLFSVSRCLLNLVRADAKKESQPKMMYFIWHIDL